MPTYDYQCRSCGSVTEVIHSMLEDGPSVCERCGGQLRRVLYPTGIIFKGSGFYRTDSRNGGSSPTSSDSTASSSDASSDSATKTEPAKDSTPKADAGGAKTTGTGSD